MRKHDEGYALTLVLVVMVVLTTVSLAVMSFSLRNLQSQQKFVERMAAEYTAQGEIEKIVAQLDKNKTFNGSKKQDAIDAMETWLEGIFAGQTIDITEDDGGVLTCLVSISAEGEKNGYQCIANCTIEVSGKIIVVESGGVTTGHKISDIAFKYTSYEIGGAT